MRRNENFLVRQVVGQYVLAPVGEAAQQFQQPGQPFVIKIVSGNHCFGVALSKEGTGVGKIEERAVIAQHNRRAFRHFTAFVGKGNPDSGQSAVGADPPASQRKKQPIALLDFSFGEFIRHLVHLFDQARSSDTCVFVLL